MFSEIISGIVSWAMSFVQTYGVWSVFIIVFIEELLIPIPSPLVIMGAGYILIPSGISFGDAIVRAFLFISLPAALASTIGSFFTYGIGYYGGKPLIIKLRRYLGVSWEDIKKTEKKLEKGKKTWAMIAALRAIPLFPIAIVSLAAGVLRLSWKKYALSTFIGSIPRTFILALAGWWVGGEFVSIANKLNLIENMLLIAVIFAVLFLLYKYRHKYIHHYRKITKISREHIKRISRKK